MRVGSINIRKERVYETVIQTWPANGPDALEADHLKTINEIFKNYDKGTSNSRTRSTTHILDMAIAIMMDWQSGAVHADRSVSISLATARLTRIFNACAGRTGDGWRMIMNRPANEAIVTELAGNVAVIETDVYSAIQRLHALGFVQRDDRWGRPIVDDADRRALVAELIQMNALFSAGKDWSPRALLEHYRDLGIVQRGYRSIAWRSPDQYVIEGAE